MSRFSRHNPRVLAAFGLTMSAGLMLAGCSGGGGGANADGSVTLTWLQGSGVQTNIDTAQALADAFHAENPDITIEVDASGGSGSDYDNLLKTRLATGEAGDLIWYNSGSQLAGLNPDQTLLNVADQPWVGDLDETFASVVSGQNGAVFGAPLQTSAGGGFFYNIPLYEKLGLTVPKTWDEFLSNAEAIKADGEAGVAQTFGDTWTSQMITLANFYNIYASNEDWAQEYTENKVKFASDPVAEQSFSKLQDLADRDLLNADFASATLDDGLRMVATGEAGHYPMLTGLFSTLQTAAPDNVDDVGFFAIPGDDAQKNGVTVWMPPAVYAPVNTPHPDAVKKFMAFVASPAGCDAILQATGATGPLLVDGCELPSDTPRLVSDLLPYFEDGDNAPALEFLSPIKGPALEQLTVEVGSKIRSAQDAAALYDQDVQKQAQQLGLAGW